MYTHASMYGVPSFGPNAYQQPPGGNYYGNSAQYHQQQYLLPPPPVPQQPSTIYYADPDTFRKNYMTQLSGLTINSRPIIQSLSVLAQDYSRYADIVVRCVQNHISKVPPTMKLPAFYLLDAISKNVYDPYAGRFASVVTPLFLETYSQVDDQTRNKMEEMLLTWRSGSPTGSDLFGSITQLAIERGVWGDGRAVSITKSQVLSELQFAVGQKERALQINPYDTDAQRKLEVLYQLRHLITDVGVSQDELRQILGQLRELVKGSGPPPPAPVPAQRSWQPPTVHYPPPHPRPSSAQYPQPQIGYPVNQFASPPPPLVIPSASSSGAIHNVDNINKILDSLKNAGVLAPALAPAQNQPSSSTEEASSDTDQAASQEYKAVILSHRSTLSSADILRTKPSVASFIYDQLPCQCKQCGIRFPDSASGKKKLDQHLDMHFAQNRKASQNTGRGHCRTWFISAEDWTHDISSNEKGKGRADSNSMTNAAPVLSEQELRSLFVVVPPGDEAKNVSCPICKENMKSEFLEDDEEWVWRNAVIKDDKIYHATCHAEAMSSTSGIAARLRNDIVGSSRGATPEGVGNSSSTPPPPSLLRQSKSPSPDSKNLGLKRKVEPDSSENSIGTPPMKKVALSTGP